MMRLTMSVKEIRTKRDELVAELDEAVRASNRVPFLREKVAAYDAVLADFPDNQNGDGPGPDFIEVDFSASGPPVDLSNMTRGEAVLTILQQMPGISPRRIVSALQDGGRTNDNAHKVSNELNRLQDRKLVERRGTGRWFLKGSA